MRRRIGWFNRLSLALLTMTILIWIRGSTISDRFVWVTNPSEDWVAVADRYPWVGGAAPRILTNVEYREISFGGGGVRAARSRWAQRQESVFANDSPAEEINAPKDVTPWGVTTKPGIYHVRVETRWMSDPVGATHAGFEFGQEVGRIWYSGWPAENWLRDTSEVRVPMWAVTMAMTVGPGIWLFREIRRRRRRPGTCEACGYDLRASAGRCPECGMEFGETARLVKSAENPAGS